MWLVADTSVDVNCGNFDDLKEMQYLELLKQLN